MIGEFHLYLVYTYPGSVPEEEPKILGGFTQELLSTAQIDRFFGRSATLRLRFMRYIRQGFVGMLIHDGSQWITYAWMSTPSSGLPPHLPKWKNVERVYWIFGCRTEERFRGKGYYKQALRLLMHQALRLEGCQPQILIDTSLHNRPSRRAISEIGFEPAGVIRCASLALPFICRFVWGEWHRHEAHPIESGHRTRS